MSRRNCPRPHYEKYTAGTSLYGSIISLDSSERGLFYTLDDNDFDNFSTIEDFQSKDKLESVPGCGEMFIFSQQKKSYRAYRLNSNPSNTAAVRAFLIDLGVGIYRNFDHHFYEFPKEFETIPPMALFCYLESFPKTFNTCIKSDFLKQNLYKPLKFTVKRETRLKNALGMKQRCLVVDVEHASVSQEVEGDLEGGNGEQHQLEPTPKATFEDSRTVIDKIAQPPSPIVGSKIILYITKESIGDEIYARYLRIEDCSPQHSTPYRKLQLWMNNEDVIESYQTICEEPEVGDMVIAIGQDNHYHRGMVKDVIGGSINIFFIDIGYSLNITPHDLFRFPKECSELPRQAARLNVEHFNEIQNVTKLETVVAVVVASLYNKSQLELTVKIYDNTGNDLLTNHNFLCN